jgi:uncharacterized lipoprotein YmbA
MKRLALLLAAATLAALAGCTTDQIARVVYYNLRVQNQAVEQPVPGQIRGEPVPFERYQQERRGEPSR